MNKLENEYLLGGGVILYCEFLLLQLVYVIGENVGQNRYYGKRYGEFISIFIVLNEKLIFDLQFFI